MHACTYLKLCTGIDLNSWKPGALGGNNFNVFLKYAHLLNVNGHIACHISVKKASPVVSKEYLDQLI